jgi:hypothetical protein
VKKSKCAASAQEIGFSAPNLPSETLSHIQFYKFYSFPNPTHQTKHGTANRWERLPTTIYLIPNPLGPESETGITSQIIFITLFFFGR